MTLTEMSYYSRKFLPFAIILILVLLIFFYAIKVLLLYFETQQPKQIYTSAVFGKIKRPKVQTASSSATPNFILDTIEGQPVTATDSAKVFLLPPVTSRFGFREKIYLMAKAFGFDTDTIKYTLDDTEATFTDDKQKLVIDITNFNFTYEYDVRKDKTVFLDAILPQKSIIEQKATDFLRSVERYPEELSKGTTHTYYYVYNTLTNKLIPSAERTQDTNVVEVDFYRPDIEPFSIVSPKYFNSQNYVIMVFNDTGYKVIKAQVKFFEKSDEQVGVYPVKTGEQAFKELQEGKGMIVASPQGSRDIAIKKMFMGYLDPDTYQEYLQPVYVFIGGGSEDDRFAAYVPAITDDQLAD